MNTPNLKFDIKKLPLSEISLFFKEHDNDYFERLSDRVDIDQYSSKLLENATFFTLTDSSKLIGLSPCYFNNDAEKVAYISSLTINEGFRGKRLGSDMIKQIATHAKTKSYKEVLVKIHYDNTASQNFYHKNGFTDFKIDKENDFRLLQLKV